MQFTVHEDRCKVVAGLRQTAVTGSVSVGIDPLIIHCILQLSVKELDQSQRGRIE